MPEGDTVWNTARVLQRALAGARLTGSDFRVPQLAGTDLTGWTVRESASRGKHLLLRLTAPAGTPAPGATPGSGGTPGAGGTSGADGTAAGGTSGGGRDWTLHSHLRMDGAWRAYAPGERWAARPAHLIRVVLRSAGAVAVGYHLHELALIPADQEESLVGHLGPDLLGPDWDPAEAVRRLAAQPDATIGEALLDQRNLAGVGNLYRCEVLFLRGVSPWTPVGAVPDLPGTVALAQRLLAANRGRWTQSTTGSLHRGQTSYVYGRRAQPCRRCGTAIRKDELGERVTYWCPVCQPDRSAP
ncbi:zinc finger domain-containing protein [Micromonospora sp. 4G57]|uniref:DNA-(apurinic or apyrimidinic site) lyase n=1 Tax=Micromonospora sicca TaxID=2202420 RepID=A0ABU5J837_9ACTN|nr:MULTISPECIES: zinc finger domain-containing protein [unclassified Micromonospora]MDZ5443138.1 zinc finger domain-containing protein [Micromonospora sp. 4G57]MDZ5488745.1 zinc finger domain-containing protein [Micromonospora sp. 4G53]